MEGLARDEAEEHEATHAFVKHGEGAGFDAGKALATSGATMRRGQSRRRTVLISVAILLASLVLFGVGIRQLFGFARPPIYRLHMVTDPVPNRQILARRMASEAHKHRSELELTARSYPSLEVLKLVNMAKEINLAMVPGGSATRRDSRTCDRWRPWAPIRST